MAGKYQAYPEYKKFGAGWLSEVPAEWETTKLKLFANLQTGTTPSTLKQEFYCENDGLPWYRPENISEDDSEINATKFLSNLGELEVKKSRSGCTVICGIGTIGKVAFAKQEFSTNQQLIAVDSKLNDKFCFYLMFAARLELESLSTGNVVRILNNERLGNLTIPLMGKNIQEKIANFLDHETAKIDALIDKQQQLIKLLKEKRQAVISHAVTKGLNPATPMRDSGVEWLGEVPAHWVVTKVKYVAELTPRKSEVENIKSQLCNFIPMEKLKTDVLVLDEVRLISEVYEGYTYFRDEDVLMAKVTPCFENKNMVVARCLENGVGFGSSEIFVLRPRLNFLNDFLYYRLQEDVFIEIATGAMTGAGGLKRVPSEFLNNFEIALPPENERVALVEYIRTYTLKFDSLVTKAESAIKLMQERRTALISAAVTGKIDLRNWQAPEVVHHD